MNAAQSAINAQKGDSLNEVDEQYARLVGATYKSVEQRPFIIDHWRRQVDFDSEYVSVWDSLDGHRLIAVRGTSGTGTDIGEDILVGITGSSTNLIGNRLLEVIAGCRPVWARASRSKATTTKFTSVPEVNAVAIQYVRN